MKSIGPAQNLLSKRLELCETSLNLLETELEFRKQEERFEFYEPNGEVEKFINLFDSPGFPYILSAGNGVGKTAVDVNIIANIIWPGRNRFFDKPIFRDWPYPKRIRYITTPKATEEIGPFHSEIVKWWPKGKYTAEKAGKNYFSQYKANGFVVDVMTIDQDVSQFESGTLGMIITDEPCPEAIYDACIGRLRLGGFLLVSMTPLTHAGWFFDRVIPSYPQNVVYADIESACRQHGIRGHLEHEHIEQMMRNWPQEEIQARAYGKSMHLRGLIYQTFDPKVHVLRNPMVGHANHGMYQIVDPHDDKPFAVIWGFPDYNGDLYIVDEWPNEDFNKMHNCQLTIDDYIKIFRDKEQRWNVTKRIMDRRYGEASRTTNRKTLREAFEDKGWFYDQSYSAHEEIETGILEVRRKLAYDTTKQIDPLNHPKLYINPHCTNTIKAFTHWARDPDSGKVQEAYKDFMDVVRYWIMDNPQGNFEVFDRPSPNKYG